MTNSFVGMRNAGRLAASTLDFITPYVQEGVTTEHLDELCHNFITSNGAIPATLGYNGYPKSTCISINEVICHGIPSSRKLENGDILNIDVTVILDGWHGDTSKMFYVGTPSSAAQRLVEAAYKSMMMGINTVKPSATIGDIGSAIQKYAESKKYSVVRDFCGHGIGREFHASPSVLHFGRPKKGAVLVEGMTFTIEPMINAGKYNTVILDDGWTAITADGSLSAQFEHTIGVTGSGTEIFTLSPKGLNLPPYNLNTL
ncbi:MAG: type I methionyl aminopeptidase [Holosporales bacterium]|jgi:methionyl aminopeptidase|nr:type I methionyl aminopeptidase [Holosporales bacterium]